jgi:hypothetical protein
MACIISVEYYDEMERNVVGIVESWAQNIPIKPSFLRFFKLTDKPIEEPNMPFKPSFAKLPEALNDWWQNSSTDLLGEVLYS